MLAAGKPFVATRPAELVRDFIADCLYNPGYGFFPSKAQIVKAGGQELGCSAFGRIANQAAYHRMLQARYGYDRYVAHDEAGKFCSKWHTPSEIFAPVYGDAIARWLVAKARALGLSRLRILEVGPGNGTLCLSVLAHLQCEHPALLATAEYHLLEIGAHLHDSQRRLLAGRFAPGICHFHCYSALDAARLAADFGRSGRAAADHWLLLGFELLDNLPHDKVAYGPAGELLECRVLSNEAAAYGEAGFAELFTPVGDAAIAELVAAMDAAGHRSPSLRRRLSDLAYVGSGLSPWAAEFVPTAAHQLLKALTGVFPAHSLLLCDFAQLADRSAGHNAPLVQACLRGKTHAVSTYLVKRGFFDVMFESNFGLLASLYRQLAGSGSECAVVTHAAMMRQWAAVEATRLADGYNPLLDEYANVRYLLATRRPAGSSKKYSEASLDPSQV